MIPMIPIDLHQLFQLFQGKYFNYSDFDLQFQINYFKIMHAIEQNYLNFCNYFHCSAPLDAARAPQRALSLRSQWGGGL